MNTQATDRRRAELAKIHLAATQLGMDTSDKDLNSEYRAMLFSVGGERSAAKLDGAGRRAVLEHLRNCGFKATPRKRVAQHPGTPHNLDREAMLQKIEAYLADMKLPWSYADAIAKQQTGIAKVAWLRKYDDLKGVVAALHVEQSKRAMLEALDKWLAEREMTREQLADQYSLPRNWMRNRRVLSGVLEGLAIQAVTDGVL